MLGIFGSIKVQNGWHKMRVILDEIDQKLPIGNQEEIDTSSKRLADLGFDMRSASNGEMRGVNLLNAWNEYKQNNLDHSFWQFLASKAPNREMKEIKLMRVVTTSIKNTLTQLENISSEVVDYFELTATALEKICERAQHLHNSKIQPQPNLLIDPEADSGLVGGLFDE